MNQRLNLEQAIQAIQFVLSPRSDSELSELTDIDDDEEDEIIQFIREKNANKYYIHLLFFVYSFVYISLLLFCLFSVVRRTQKFNLKLPSLIASVMSFRAGKIWLFYLKLEVNVFFRGPVLQFSRWFHRFMIFGVFFILVMILSWTMMEMKRTKSMYIQLMKMIMMTKKQWKARRSCTTAKEIKKETIIPLEKN